MRIRISKHTHTPKPRHHSKPLSGKQLWNIHNTIQPYNGRTNSKQTFKNYITAYDNISQLQRDIHESIAAENYLLYTNSIRQTPQRTPAGRLIVPGNIIANHYSVTLVDNLTTEQLEHHFNWLRRLQTTPFATLSHWEQTLLRHSCYGEYILPFTNTDMYAGGITYLLLESSSCNYDGVLTKAVAEELKRCDWVYTVVSATHPPFNRVHSS